MTGIIIFILILIILFQHIEKNKNYELFDSVVDTFVKEKKELLKKINEAAEEMQKGKKPWKKI